MGVFTGRIIDFCVASMSYTIVGHRYKVLGSNLEVRLARVLVPLLQGVLREY